MADSHLAIGELKNSQYTTEQSSTLLFFGGMLLVLFLTALELIASLGLILGLPIGPLHLPIAILVTWIIGYLSSANLGINKLAALSSLVTVLVIIALSVAAAASFYDRSFDGQAYHQEAILQLAAGWNPYYDTLAETAHERLWLTHYPKGPWYLANAFYAITGSIESGKATNLILIIASGCFLASLLLAIRMVPAWLSISITVLAALNPVSVYQALTFYVDGQLSSIFVSLIAVLIMAAAQPNRYVLVCAAALMMLLINIKFTGLAYAGLIAISFGVASLYLHKWRDTFRYSSIIALGVFVGVLAIGFAPYVSNTIDKGNIFHPLRGENAIDVISHAKPEPLKSMNRVQATAVSIFSESSNSKTEYKLRAPFHIPKGRELREASAAEPRLGGFGPWFSGAFIGGLILILAGQFTRKDLLIKGVIGYLLVCLTATIFINPEAWWARYVPQLYLIPLAACLASYTSESRILRTVALGTLITLFANLSMIGYFSVKSDARLTKAINKQLAQLKKSDEHVVAYFSIAPSLRARLNRAGISYSSVTEERDLPCDDPNELASGHGAKFCSVKADSQ